MIFKPFYYFDTGCAAYVLGCGSLGVCAVIDAQYRDIASYREFAGSKSMRIAYIIDTHVHADHRSGGPELARQVGAAYCLHETAQVDLSFEPIRDGQEIELGNTRVTVLHTPGHSPESICLLVTDLRRGPDPWFVLTGDTLFVGAVGRPDLPLQADQNAADLYTSIHTKLLTLPADLEVYPAHFAGSACGVGMSGKPSTTIGFEIRYSPLLSADREAFVAALATVPDKPAELEEILRFNQGRSVDQPGRAVERPQ